MVWPTACGSPPKRVCQSESEIMMTGLPSGRPAAVTISFALRAEKHQLPRVPVRQGLEQHGAGDGENRGVGADTQRQRKNCSHAESKVLVQHPRTKTQILPECLQPCLHVPSIVRRRSPGL